MQIFFAGAEAPTHLNLLKQCGVERVAVNINNLARHTSKYADWASSARLGGLDWLVYADTPSCPAEPVLELLTGSQVACEAVAGPVNWATDTWLKDSDLGFFPIWDGRDTSVARVFAEDYEGLVLPDSVVDNPVAVRTARAALPAMGTLGGLTGRSKGIERFDIVVSSAWWAVQKHGETQVWVGTRLVRLNAEDKHLKRQRYADSIEALGCDVSAVLADDPTETVRCSVLSWMALERHINSLGRHPGGSPLVANPSQNGSSNNVIPIGGVARPHQQTGHQTVPALASGLATRTLPLMGLDSHITTTEDADGNTLTETHNTIEVTADSARQCSTCILSAACPSFNPGSRCAYNIPVVIKTKDQRQAVLRGLVEIQTQRIMFGAFSEQALGTPDPSVGKEIDRLFTMVEKWKAIEENTSKLRISVDAQGDGQAAGMGMISRLFGEQAGTNARLLERPMIVDELVEELVEEGEPHD